MAESHSEDSPLLGVTDPPSPGGDYSLGPGGDSPSWQRPYAPGVDDRNRRNEEDEDAEDGAADEEASPGERRGQQRLNVPAAGGDGGVTTPKSVRSQTSMDSGCECDPSEGDSNSSPLSHQREEAPAGPSGLIAPLAQKESLDCHCGAVGQGCSVCEVVASSGLHHHQQRRKGSSPEEGEGCQELLLTHTDRGELQTASCIKVSFSIGYDEPEEFFNQQDGSSSTFSTNIIESTSQSGSEPGDEFKELVRSAPKSFPRVTSYSKTGMLSASSSTASMPMCRICHFPQGDDMLISPCRCSGTMQFIHESCLSRWLEISSKRKKPATCELCYYQFNRHKKFKLRHWQLPSCSRLDKILHSIFLLCLLVMVTCATITIYCFKQDRFVKKREDTDLTRSEIVTLTCGVLFFVAFFMAMYVEVKAKDTLYRLFSKFLYLNQTWHIDEYDKRKDKQHAPV